MNRTVEIDMYRKKDLIIQGMLNIRRNNMTAYKKTKNNGNIKLTFSPSIAVIIKLKSDYSYNVFIPLEKFYDVLEAFNRIKKSFKFEDIYYIDTESKLILNKVISDKYKLYMDYFGKILTVTHTIINIDNIQYEGVNIGVNGGNILLTYKEFKNMVNSLKKIDMVNMSINLAIYEQLMLDIETTPIIRNDFIDEDGHTRIKKEKEDNLSLLTANKERSKRPWV